MSTGPDLYHVVTVTTHTRRGLTKLHTFEFFPFDDQPGFNYWAIGTPASARQEKLRVKHDSRAIHPAYRHLDLQPMNLEKLGRGIGGHTREEWLDERRITLGRGVTPQGTTLAVVLEALRSAGRREIDLADLKVILSQLGSHITGLNALPDDQRAAAAPALYAAILNRCS